MRYTTLLLGLSLVAACEHPSKQGEYEEEVQARRTEPAEAPPPTDMGGARTPSTEQDEVSVVVVDPTARQKREVEHLVATIDGDEKHPNVQGVVHLRKVPGAVEVVTEVEGLPPGTHGAYVNMYGDCTDLANDSSGPRFDFDAVTIDASSMTTPPSRMPSSGSTGGSTGSAGGSTGSAGSPGMGGSTGSTGSSGMGGSAKGTTGGTGSIGLLDATTGRPARTVLRIEDLDEDLGLLNGRSVVIEIADPVTGGTPIACGVIGVAGDQTAGLPIDIDENRVP
jgi:hypothetical protein